MEALLLIDPQKDFTQSNGALFVPGAVEDMQRISAYIEKNIANIEEIYVSFDSHLKVHIAHAIFWTDKNNEHPKPFTTITYKDVLDGKWKTANSKYQSWAEYYTGQLEKSGKYTLTIWAEHCIFGSEMWKMDPILDESIQKWEDNYNAINYIVKGGNKFTEHYSILKTEVQREDDLDTGLNVSLISKLKLAEKIIVAGECLSHCVRATLEDLAEEGLADRITVLKDCCSIIPGFEKQTEEFLKQMEFCGMKIKVSDQ